MAISSVLGSSALAPAGLGFRNKIINGGFDIWQRGTSFSSAGFTADRWLLQVDGSGATRSVTQQSFTPGNVITGQEPKYFLRYNQSVAGSGGTFNILDSRIEDVRTCAGQTVTVSFWAKADSTRTINSSIQQVFDGSPEVTGLASGNITITTSWVRYSYTGVLASIAGKTIGANSYIALRFNLPLNTTFTFDVWGVQLEQNYVITPFEQRPIGVETLLCQRYFYRINSHASNYNPVATAGINNSATQHWRTTIILPVPMRRALVTADMSWSTLVAYDAAGIVFVTSGAISGNDAGETMINVDWGSGGNLTTGRPVVVMVQPGGGSAYYWQVNAEL